MLSGLLRIVAALTLALCIWSLQAADAHGIDPLMSMVLTSPASFDSQRDCMATGVDLNLAILILNAGLSYRHWEKDIVGWDNKETVRNEITYYAGIGFGGLLQTQVGFSRTGTLLRIRSDLVFFGDITPLYSSMYPKWLIIRQGIVLSPFVETSPWSENKRTIFGAGIGVHF